MNALQLYAGPRALARIRSDGLRPGDVQTIPGAAGGPKGLILGPLDRFLFGDWLARSDHPIDLVGASIGAWRMATACLNNPAQALLQFEHQYIHQNYAPDPGGAPLSADRISERFGQTLNAFFAPHLAQVLAHRRFHLHVITSRGRHILAREGAWRTPVGYLGAFASNVVHRKALGFWLDRDVFSQPGRPLPFATADFPTHQAALSPENFSSALQASCAIPFVLRAMQDIAGGPPGAYWDGGITDYHLHLQYTTKRIAQKRHPSWTNDHSELENKPGIVLYPHFQQQVVPGWLDKSLKWRHSATPWLDDMLLLAPHPEWVKTLPNAKLPDRNDFQHYGANLAGRVAAWRQATSKAEQLATEFAQWLDKPDPSRVVPI